MGKPRIVSIEVEWLTDEYPDTSWLGEYTSHRPDDYLINRGWAFERKDAGRGEYRYFIPEPSGEYHFTTLQKMGYSKGQADYLARKYCRENFERMESLNDGAWCFLGCQAKATVSYPIGQGSRRLEHFTSGGLWGIESDSAPDYMDEIACNELADLKAHLETFGGDVSGFDELAAGVDRAA